MPVIEPRQPWPSRQTYHETSHALKVSDEVPYTVAQSLSKQRYPYFSPQIPLATDLQLSRPPGVSSSPLMPVRCCAALCYLPCPGRNRLSRLSSHICYWLQHPVSSMSQEMQKESSGGLCSLIVFRSIKCYRLNVIAGELLLLRKIRCNRFH